jgi:hypothetical protein
VFFNSDAGPETAQDSGFAPRSSKLREEYSALDFSADNSPCNVKELDDSMRPSLDRGEGKQK